MNIVTREQLAADLKAVIKDSEELLKATVADAGTQIGGVRERLEDSLRAARTHVDNAARTAMTSTSDFRLPNKTSAGKWKPR